MKENEDINFICTAGGMKAMFISKCLSTLNNFNCNIRKASGASSGAFAAACIICKVDTNVCIDIYRELQQRDDKMYIGEVMKEFCERVLPSDAHLLCNKRLYVAIHILSLCGIRRKIINEFHSREDLIDCLLASSTVPYYTFPKLYYKFREWNCIDGIYPQPIGKYKTIYCNLWGIKYPYQLSASIKDNNIDKFVENGKTHFEKWVSEGKKSKVFHIFENGYSNIKMIFIGCLLRLIGYIPIMTAIYLLIRNFFYLKSFLYNLN